jgi:hypothetical protein
MRLLTMRQTAALTASQRNSCCRTCIVSRCPGRHSAGSCTSTLHRASGPLGSAAPRAAVHPLSLSSLRSWACTHAQSVTVNTRTLHARLQTRTGAVETKNQVGSCTSTLHRASGLLGSAAPCAAVHLLSLSSLRSRACTSHTRSLGGCQSAKSTIAKPGACMSIATPSNAL